MTKLCKSPLQLRSWWKVWAFDAINPFGLNLLDEHLKRKAFATRSTCQAICTTRSL